MPRLLCPLLLLSLWLVSCSAAPAASDRPTPPAVPAATAPARPAPTATTPALPATDTPTHTPDAEASLPTAAIDRSVALTQRFQSGNKRLTLQHPAGWTVTTGRRTWFPVERAFSLTNTPNPRYTGEAGQIQITIYDPLELIEATRVATTVGRPLEELLDSWRRGAQQKAPFEIIATEEARFGERAFIRQDARTANGDIRSYFIRSSDGSVVWVEAVTPRGEMRTVAPTVEAIAASVAFLLPEAPQPGTPAFTVREAFRAAQRGEDADAFTCIQDGIGGALISSFFKLDESLLGTIAEATQTQIKQGKLTLNYDDLFYESVYTGTNEAMVAVGGTATVNDGEQTVIFPVSRVFGINGALRALGKTGRTWQLCQTLMLTGFGELRQAEEARREAQGVPAEPQIYWLDRDKDVVSRMTLYGTELQRFTKLGEPGWFALDTGAQQLYLLTRERQLKRIDLATMETTVVACQRREEGCPDTELPGMGGPVIDPAGRMIYWRTGDSVFRADLDLQNVSQIAALGSWYVVLDVALDPMDDTLYIAARLPFADTKNKQVTAFYRSALDGSGLEQLGTVPGEIEHLAYAQGGLFFTTQLKATIERFDIAARTTTVVAKANRSIATLAADPDEGKLYWVQLNKAHFQQSCPGAH
ncbi:MAG TPA: hypothetical protein VFS21_20350 [Roseiflexaceae bacterium]|nr:hypothetical protein [Roseiflexaceae bacterium]